jgi:unsaturated rhamnogalacturonyl hydrolase
MSKVSRFSVSIFLFLALVWVNRDLAAQKISSKSAMEAMVLANKYFMDKWPDVGREIVTEPSTPSNTWTRSVYYEGLMALYSINQDTSCLIYALRWGKAHKWGLHSGIKTRDADNQCCGQTYIDLYLLDRYKEERINDIRTCVDSMLVTDKIDDWNWIGALQMAMPVFARLGKVYMNEKYYNRMNEMYEYTKTKLGKNGLYNTVDHLWWRDTTFMPPYKEPNGENCYWARGNGWVVAALARSVDFISGNSAYKRSYLKTLKEMLEAIVPLQRADGFWNVSLKDSTHFGGKEATGTALFVYGIAWGINNGVLSKKEYLPVVTKAWNALVTESLHPNGFLGYVQGTGKEPKDGQPVGYDIVPNFEDYGLGCFLLAGTEIYKLAKSTEPKEKTAKKPKEKKSSTSIKNSKSSKGRRGNEMIK